MSSIVKTACEVKGGLFRCRSEAVAYCQYCGRPFCAEHTTVRGGEGKEVCSRKFCVAKWDDLQKHLVYKAAVDERNAASACGIDGCGAGTQGQCVRCKGHFCAQHVQPREEPVLHNKVVINQMATLCYHCWQRRPIWVRM
jgi:hypothetical protein